MRFVINIFVDDNFIFFTYHLLFVPNVFIIDEENIEIIYFCVCLFCVHNVFIWFIIDANLCNFVFIELGSFKFYHSHRLVRR